MALSIQNLEALTGDPFIVKHYLFVTRDEPAWRWAHWLTNWNENNNLSLHYKVNELEIYTLV